MKFNKLESELFYANSIFDFISIIFYYISKQNVTALNGRYKKCISSKEYESEFINLDDLFNSLFYYEDIDGYEYTFFKKEWINLYKNKKIDCAIYCFETLYLFDNYYSNYNPDSQAILQNQGPLNKAFKDKVLFYRCSPKGVLNNYLEENNIREGRQYIIDNPTNLDSKFKNFHIIDITSLSSFNPKVIKYNKTINIKKTSLIGIVPSKTHENIETIFDKESKLFDIKYRKENYLKHMKYIFNTLLDMDSLGYKIVIFPELFLFPESLDNLKNFLSTHMLNNIELIFTGSVWNNNKNCSYILSSSGSILNKHSKKIPYEHFSKSDETLYAENIEIENSIEFLDIPGIGRISYLICRDFITGKLQNLCIYVMKADVLCVSAYTSKTESMLDASKSCAKLNGVASILCNSCSATKDDCLLGYIVTPKAENKKLSYNDKLFSKNDIKCTDCKHCFLINKL